MPPIKILIADDHAVFRKGLRRILDMARDMNVVEEARHGLEALELVRRLHPDVALLDVRMPHMDGIAATRRIRNDCPSTQVIILSMYAGEEEVLGCLQAGARGYLLKDCTPEELLAAIRQVREGQGVIDGRVASRVLDALTRWPAAGGMDRQPSAAVRLTQREHQVLHLVRKGYDNKRVAEVLSIAPSTVKAHLRSIYRKLNVTSRTQAVVRSRLRPSSPP